MDIFDLSGKLGHNPCKADGTTMNYKEQCAYIAGCLDVWFTLLQLNRTSPKEIARCMQMSDVEVGRMYILWHASNQ